MSQAKGTAKQRDPPPSLFLQPSPAASHVSLSLTAAGPAGSSTATGSGLTSQGSVATQRHPANLRHEPGSSTLSPIDSRKLGQSSHGQTLRSGAAYPPPLQLRQESTRATDRTDALWAEMQATLEEVELSASGGTRVFGPDHDRKLAELRHAQIALAQAWARSEADDAIETNHPTTDGDMRNLKSTVSGTKDGGDAGGRTEGSTAATSARPGSSGLGTERLGAKLEEETKADILLARKRREANDRYFQSVNQGVLDVVARLEEVAVAMRAVEKESRDIWGDESPPHSAKT